MPLTVTLSIGFSGWASAPEPISMMQAAHRFIIHLRRRWQQKNYYFCSF
jgi:hypothetical protein